MKGSEKQINWANKIIDIYRRHLLDFPIILEAFECYVETHQNAGWWIDYCKVNENDKDYVVFQKLNNIPMNVTFEVRNKIEEIISEKSR